MRRSVFFLLVAFCLAASGPTGYIINQPPGPAGYVIPGPPEQHSGVWRSDPTVRWIRNCSQTAFIKIWFGCKTGKPQIEMGPEETVRVNLPLGKNVMLVEGEMKAGPYGWQNLGQFSRIITIGPSDYPGWEITITTWDFPRGRHL